MLGKRGATALLVVIALLSGGAGGAGVTFLLLGGGRAGASALASGSMTLLEASAIVNVANKINPGVVTVLTEVDAPAQRRGATVPESASGSGFIVDPKGYIVTNAHVVQGAQSLSVVFTDGERKEAKLIGTDQPFTDLAVIKVEADKLEPVSFGDSDALVPGQRVIAVGSALGDFRNTITQGIVSGLHRTWRGSGGVVIEDLIQTDAAINHGNSGGPLVNTAAQVVGINTSVIRQTQAGDPVEGIGFAIPSNTARLVARQLVEKGRVARPDVGFTQQRVSPALASFYGLPVRYGAFVLQVNPGGPAAQSGIKEGDIVTRVGNDAIDEAHPYVNLLIKHEPGEKVTFTLNREGREMKVDITLNERQ